MLKDDFSWTVEKRKLYEKSTQKWDKPSKNIHEILMMEAHLNTAMNNDEHKQQSLSSVFFLLNIDKLTMPFITH